MRISRCAIFFFWIAKRDFWADFRDARSGNNPPPCLNGIFGDDFSLLEMQGGGFISIPSDRCILKVGDAPGDPWAENTSPKYIPVGMNFTYGFHP